MTSHLRAESSQSNIENQEIAAAQPTVQQESTPRGSEESVDVENVEILALDEEMESTSLPDNICTTSRGANCDIS